MRRISTVAMAVVTVVATGCGVGSEATVQEGAPATMTYDQFLSRVLQEDSGEFIADGDTLFEDEPALQRFYAEHVARPEVATVAQELCVMTTSSGTDVKWSSAQQRNLTYCVSTKFGTRHDAVVSAMAAAASAWERVANVKYVYDATQDSKCTASNTKVVFDVNPVNVNGQYIARSFFPNTSRRSRNVKIDNSAFTSSGDPTLTGVLRHELGHTLGFRHEHTRPEAGACFEDNNWRALTTYDSASVMHYPQCNGTGDWSLTLTTRDAQGAAKLYPF
jgi:hypothetical protein